MNKNRMISPRSTVLGFSIVELMVAMTIGLVILLATTAIFVQSKQSNTTQDSLARLQENSRFAMQFMMRDLRMAGYFGCADDISTVVNTLNGVAEGGPYDVSSAIQGSENNSAWFPTAAPPVGPPPLIIAGTDALSLRYLDPNSALAVTPPIALDASGPLAIAPNSALREGDIALVTDCGSSAIFQITGSTTAGSIAHAVTPQTPGNFTANLGNKIYDNINRSEVGKYYYAAYYIRDGASGPALYRDALVLDTSTNNIAVQPQELVEGIDNMQILYGVDNTGDRVPDQYVKADAVANWLTVKALRIGILARSLAQTQSGSKEYGTEQDTRQYDVDGDGTTDFTAPGDRFERRVFRTTVLMRNLL